MGTIGINTQMGIDLARQGYKDAALPYLRRAVTSEVVNAEVWLWLAHVSPDINEYRNCVYQALTLDPHHPTAQRMQQDINYQSQGTPPTAQPTQAVQSMMTPDQKQHRFRRLLILANVIVIFAACGLLMNVARQTITEDMLADYLPFLETRKRIQFAAGNEDEAFGFRVDVPQSWYLADTGSPSWQAERDRLQEEFPNEAGAPNIWQNFQADLGNLTRDENSGAFEQTVAIIETDSEKLKQSADIIPNLSLISVVDENGDTSCEGLERLGEQEARLLQSRETFIESEIRGQTEDRCILVLIYQTEDPDTQIYRLYVPVETNSIAQWHLSLPVSMLDTYEKTIQNILNSLTYLPPAQTSLSEEAE